MSRKTISLNGQWHIAYDPEEKGELHGYPSGALPEADLTYVPSCWNFELGRYDYFGVAWYSRKFNTAQTCNCRIVFHAVSGEAVVYLDGKELGSHYGSYTKFWFDVSQLPAGEHSLVVKVDNKVNDEDTLPLRFVDWFVWGGIYRGVEIELFENLSIDGIRVETDWRGLEVDRVTIKTFVKNWSQNPITDTFKLEINGKGFSDKTLTIAGGETAEVEFVVDQFTPQLWSPNDPQLYMVHVCSEQDDLFERTGFRKIEVQDTHILLNGKEILIKGINRHNDDPELGYAINPPLILRDMHILRDLGVNAVRGSHYPNDPMVLDYCDQFGLLFWEEIPFWNHPADALASRLLAKRAHHMIKEMIIRDYNHPCIIFWGIQNESKSSSQEGLDLFGKIAEEIRELDRSRLVSFASSCGRDDICFDLVDVVCWNMYPGWYDDDRSLDDLDKRFAESLRDHRKWLEENGQSKPFIISEFGAGAILGDTSFDTGMRWTENYQEKLVEKVINAIVNCGVVQGFYIWQFCDTRTALLRKTSIGRPRNFNNKGLVDEHRKPKRAYYMVKSLLKKIPTYTGYIASPETKVKTTLELREEFLSEERS